MKQIHELLGYKNIKIIQDDEMFSFSVDSMLLADFIKTSTGKQEPGATPAAAIVMCNSIKEYYRKTGRKVGFKPAGGISSVKDALCYLAIVDTILGKEWLTPELFRIGASRLANNLLSALEQKTVGYY